MQEQEGTEDDSTPARNRRRQDVTGQRSSKGGRLEGVARVVGAWRAGNRAGDEVIRERLKERSAWARHGLLGLVLGAIFTQQMMRDRAEFNQREQRDGQMAQAFTRLADELKAFRQDLRDSFEHRKAAP